MSDKLTEEEKRTLAERHGYTVNGEPCMVAGYAMDEATVGLPDGTYYHADWDAIQRAVANDGVIEQDDLVSVPQKPMVVELIKTIFGEK